MVNMYDDIYSFAEMNRLGFDASENIHMRINLVYYKKRLAKIMNEVKKRAIKNKCYQCGKEITSLCNSHSIPAFILRNIAYKGELYNINKFIGSPLMSNVNGVNNSGTFRLICRECDQTIFGEYENPCNYEFEPTTKMLVQIALKNYLMKISKRIIEIKIYNKLLEELPNEKETFNEKIRISKVDIKEYQDDFAKVKRLLNMNLNGEYYLIYHKVLDYVVPFASQDGIVLFCDFEDNIINNIYSNFDNEKMHELQVCVFPMGKKSVVLLFIDSDIKGYRKFYKQFRKLSDNDKLAAINYIAFAYSENILISKNINETVLEDKNFADVINQTSDILTNSLNIDVTKVALKGYTFKKMHDIPNLLSEEYSITNI